MKKEHLFSGITILLIFLNASAWAYWVNFFILPFTIKGYPYFPPQMPVY